MAWLFKKLEWWNHQKKLFLNVFQTHKNKVIVGGSYFLDLKFYARSKVLVEKDNTVWAKIQKRVKLFKLIISLENND
jgi:hypothetical protein